MPQQFTNLFDVDGRLAAIHSRFPIGDERPIVALTANHDSTAATLADTYYRQVVAAGGAPLIIPPVADAAVIAAVLDAADALLLTGGADLNPLYTGEEPLSGLGSVNAARDLPELLTVRMALQRQLPILGICRGHQLLTVAMGGHVCQDMATATPATPPLLKHSQQADRSTPTHTVTVATDSLLSEVYGLKAEDCSQGSEAGKLYVNSFHHQAVVDAGAHLRVTARATDGTVEAVESTEWKPIMGVQWHPECMGDDGLPLFRWLVEQARLHREAKHLHRRIVTLDSHCDTPMFFHQGVDFACRDPRLCVDLHKMHEGRLDAVVMVAYLPQDWPAGWSSPRQYADDIFDQIERMVQRNSSHLALARTAADLMANKLSGRKSIMLGIENGLALEGRLDLVEHFARRGIVYITLCHNGDNDLCDSARGNATHGGLSPFGEQVVGEMNRLGVLVDLSHAHERTFYDVLDVSTRPVACSHSSARALCDHPRNLTDDQMRRLAQHDGVMQLTLYPGFLAEQPSTATVLTFIDHLDHAIRVMGIDHVGIGTDFDGDGGVPGLAHAGELIAFTRHLLARRYSHHDIERIWGANFLRVLGAQAARPQ